MKTKVSANGDANVQRVTVAGRPLVILDEHEYDRLKRDADSWEPAMPEADANGNYPALETMRAIMARGILRDRRRLGWSQEELARRAGIRLETLARLEHAEGSPSVRVVDKIDRALKLGMRRVKKPAK